MRKKKDAKKIERARKKERKAVLRSEEEPDNSIFIFSITQSLT
jgi:hypothetical protein